MNLKRKKAKPRISSIETKKAFLFISNCLLYCDLLLEVCSCFAVECQAFAFIFPLFLQVDYLVENI